MKRVIAFLLLAVLLSLCGCTDEREAEWAAQIAAYREAKLVAYAEENERYADYECDVAFLGDSLTDGYDLGCYYPQYFVANRGIGGDTTVGLADRLAVSLYELKPKVAVLLIGVNNIDTMLDNYEDILKSFCENVPNTEVVILSLTSMGGEWGRKNQLAAYNNVRIKLLAEKYSFSYVDLYSALMDPETGEIVAAYTTDGGHLTPKGYEVLTAMITPAIEACLASWYENNAN